MRRKHDSITLTPSNISFFKYSDMPILKAQVTVIVWPDFKGILPTSKSCPQDLMGSKKIL